MEKYYSSIFNEVFGPIMIGTSSSHTAGPYRIGATARMLLNEKVVKARISFDANSSYGSYYQLQWSDRGWTAGLFGGRIDSEDVTDALEIAKEKGLDVQFVKEPKANKHANYALLELEGEKGGKLDLGTLSVGGAAIEIIEIDGFPILIKGDFNTIFLYFNEKPDEKEFEKKVTEIVKEEVRVHTSEANGKYLLYFETRAVIDDSMRAQLEVLAGVTMVRTAEHVLPVLSSFRYEGIPFHTAEEALKYSETEKLSAGELGIRYEMARSGYSRAEVMDMMKNVVRVMRKCAYSAIHNITDEKVGDLYDIKATEIINSINNKTVKSVNLGVLNELACIALGVLEVVEQKRPEVVVASPTVGSVGILPAAVVRLGDLMAKNDDEIATAMFAAGVVGTFIAHEGSFGGEVCGCQAECGSAGSMAAAGIVEMLDGNAQQAFTAAAVSLQNVLGLICDPVSVGYEPCNSRNCMEVANAVTTANMVVGGFMVQIPLDETIIAMKEVGDLLPPCLKGTCGGLSATPTGKKVAEFCERCNK